MGKNGVTDADLGSCSFAVGHRGQELQVRRETLTPDQPLGSAGAAPGGLSVPFVRMESFPGFPRH